MSRVFMALCEITILVAACVSAYTDDWARCAALLSAAIYVRVSSQEDKP